MSDFLKELNEFYKSDCTPLLSNSTVLKIHKKWRINKSIFSVLESLFVEIKDSEILAKKDELEKVVHSIEVDPNSNVEHDKFKIWLTSKIILKVYTHGNYDKLEMFIAAIWKNYSVLYKLHVPEMFEPKSVYSNFKPIWSVFTLFKKQKAQPEIYYVFFNDFFLKLFDPVIAERSFLKFLKIFFKKNKLEIVRAFSYEDYLRLYEIQKISGPLFDRIPDLSNTDVVYSHKNRALPQSTCFMQVFNLLSGYGVSYFFVAFPKEKGMIEK
jgi:hypothetical protein